MFKKLFKYFFSSPITSYIIPADERKRQELSWREMIRNAKNEIWIVDANLDPELYNKEFADLIRKKMEDNPNFRCNIIFSNDALLSREVYVDEDIPENIFLPIIQRY